MSTHLSCLPAFLCDFILLPGYVFPQQTQRYGHHRHPVHQAAAAIVYYPEPPAPQGLHILRVRLQIRPSHKGLSESGRLGLGRVSGVIVFHGDSSSSSDRKKLVANLLRQKKTFSISLNSFSFRDESGKLKHASILGKLKGWLPPVFLENLVFLSVPDETIRVSFLL